MQTMETAPDHPSADRACTEMRGSHLEVHERGGGRWLIDRVGLRYVELPPDRDVDVETCGLAWMSFLDVRADDATGDLVIQVTPTRIVRLRHSSELARRSARLATLVAGSSVNTPTTKQSAEK